MHESEAHRAPQASLEKKDGKGSIAIIASCTVLGVAVIVGVVSALFQLQLGWLLVTFPFEEKCFLKSHLPTKCDWEGLQDGLSVASLWRD